MKAHTADVFCVDMNDEIIVSGSGDKTIRLWDKRNGKCIRTVKSNFSLHEKLAYLKSNSRISQFCPISI